MVTLGDGQLLVNTESFSFDVVREHDADYLVERGSGHKNGKQAKPHYPDISAFFNLGVRHPAPTGRTPVS